METLFKDVLVIGSGPSGLLSGILASKQRKVTLIEKPGKNFMLSKRILVSGNGRANFYNEDLLTHSIKKEYLPILEDEEHDYSKEFLDYLTKEGFSYTKEGKLYYPYFKRSECLHSFLMEKIKDIEVLPSVCLSVNPRKKEVLLLLNGQKVLCHYQELVLSIGARSYDRKDYSYDILDSLGVSYYPYQSMLCPIRTVEKIPSYLNKQRLRGKLTLKEEDRILYEEEGELLFKEDGLSGIALFDSTLYLHDALRKNKKSKFTYLFDYAYDKGLTKDTSLSCYPSFLRKYLQERRLRPLQTLSFTFEDFYPFEDSQASYGGILLSQLNLKDFSLKEYPDIHAIGEMLDVNLPCGGYNIGISFIEGYRLGNILGGRR